MDPFTGVAAALLAAGAAWFYFSKTSRNVLRVESALKQLGPSYTVLERPMLTSAGGMMRFDWLVVSPFALFVVNEQKAEGRVEVQPGQREWEVKAWRKKERLYNPLWRNRQGINLLREQVGEVPVISLVVFSAARLAGNKDQDVLTVGELLPRIRQFTRPVLDTGQQEKVLALFGKKTGGE